MTSLRLRSHVHAGHTLSEPELRALWQLRLGFVSLKPTVDPAVDYASFCKIVRAADVLVVRDDEARVRGMGTWQPIDVDDNGPARLGVLCEYGFLDRSAGGHPAYVWPMLRAAVEHVLRARGAPVLVGGVGYPSSFLSFSRVFGRVHHLQEPGLSLQVRAFLERMVRTVGGPDGDATTGVVPMRTVPQVPSTSWWTRNHGPELIAYENACPAWRDGMGLAFCVEFAPQNLAHMARTVMRRATRTATRVVTHAVTRPMSPERS